MISEYGQYLPSMSDIALREKMNGARWKGMELNGIIGDDISIKSANVKLNINDVCNLISVSSERFN